MSDWKQKKRINKVFPNCPGPHVPSSECKRLRRHFFFTIHKSFVLFDNQMLHRPKSKYFHYHQSYAQPKAWIKFLNFLFFYLHKLILTLGFTPSLLLEKKYLCLGKSFVNLSHIVYFRTCCNIFFHFGLVAP